MDLIRYNQHKKSEDYKSPRQTLKPVTWKNKH